MKLLVKSVNDRGLQDLIVQKSRLCHTTVKDETRTTLKGILRQGIEITPPGSQGVKGKAAQRAGEATIVRDLGRMGFVPVDIKGFRMVTHAFGRPITPVQVKTKENPKFADPEAHHAARIRSKHSGRVTRGGKQAFYVSRRKITSLKNKLFKQVGHLASGWVRAAQQLGVPVPAWIARHGPGRGSEVQVLETKTKITMRVVNHFPDTASAEADTMLRRIAFLKTAAIGRLKRQLPYLLKKNLGRK